MSRKGVEVRPHYSSQDCYIIWEAQCKMKVLSFLFKTYQEFQDGDSRVLNELWGPLQCQALVNSCTPMKPTLTVPTDISTSFMVSISSRLRESLLHNQARSTHMLIFLEPYSKSQALQLAHLLNFSSEDSEVRTMVLGTLKWQQS